MGDKIKKKEEDERILSKFCLEKSRKIKIKINEEKWKQKKNDEK